MYLYICHLSVWCTSVHCVSQDLTCSQCGVSSSAACCTVTEHDPAQHSCLPPTSLPQLPRLQVWALAAPHPAATRIEDVTAGPWGPSTLQSPALLLGWMTSHLHWTKEVRFLFHWLQVASVTPGQLVIMSISSSHQSGQPTDQNVLLNL